MGYFCNRKIEGKSQNILDIGRRLLGIYFRVYKDTYKPGTIFIIMDTIRLQLFFLIAIITHIVCVNANLSGE